MLINRGWAQNFNRFYKPKCTAQKQSSGIIWNHLWTHFFNILIKNKYLFDLWIFYRVIASASPEDDCLLYKLANFKKSGQLVDAFNTGGSKEVIRKKNINIV